MLERSSHGDRFHRSKFFDIDVRSASPELADLIARKDWSATPLGPSHRWPPALRTTLEIMLSNRFPMVFWWGPDFIQLYNDAYRAIVGAKHPKALGQPARECWAEIWDVIGPQMTSIYAGGPGTWNEDLLLEPNRFGFKEETYFTFSYGPLPDPAAPNGIGGVLATVQETTQKVLGERRIRMLRDLASHGTTVQTVHDACRLAAQTLDRYARSVPFALIYLIDESRTAARLAASAGVDDGAPAAPLHIDLTGAPAGPWPLHIDLTGAPAGPWPLQKARTHDGSLLVTGLEARLEHVPPGPWPEPPRNAIIVPLKAAGADEPAGFLVAGVSPRIRLDDEYRGFFELVGGQIAAALASARAYEDERKRAAALAELDRAKIAFFSNISHEFRTPLTLLLGPLEELARRADGESAPLVDVAARNALRLLKLVNTLLEFSRIEAGRAAAAFTETDLAALTADLCAMFRAAIETAGLTLDVDIRLREPVYVDRAMWEKIVLNLLSNALKFTLTGGIRVMLETAGDAALLRVCDTGVGIPEHELPRLFERFHRVVGTRSRSHEGSGIGLALVEELVLMHGGTVRAESRLGAGSTFEVRIPLGSAHLDPEQVVSAAGGAAHVSVAQQYLADVDATITRAGASRPAFRRPDSGTASRILFADDNGDLRDYVARILAPFWEVVTARNGTEALALLAEGRVDLILSDVMMSDADGFALLAAVRGDPAHAAIPFILLSARADEASAITGLGRGADDYLAKPFSSDELVARIAAHLNAASIRDRATADLRSSEERFRTLAASMPHIIVEADANGAVTFLSNAWTRYTGKPAEAGLGSGWSRSVHPDELTGMAQRWSAAVAAGNAFREHFRMRRDDGRYRWHLAHILPQAGAGGAVVRWTGTITDVDDQLRAVREREFLFEASRILAQSLDLQTTLQNIARLTVPEFADWCQIDLRTPDGRIRTVAIAHRDPAKHELAQALVGHIHLDETADAGSPGVIRSGHSELIEDVPRAIREAISDAGERDLYRRLGVGSAACIPLVAQGRTLGAIGVAFGDSQRSYSSDDLALLEELGRRAGLAVHNASEFEREHRVAQSFQEASLPSVLPQLPGLSFDAVYVPSNDEAQVGGDWYDAVRLFDGRVVISIGDVTGNGLGAAVTMGNMRQTIRGIAQVHADPALMLDAADRALRLEHPDRIVTAFVGVLDPIARTFAFASAGHPPPLLRRHDGTIEFLRDGGLPLGLRQSAEKSCGATIALPDDAHLVFYTDGLTEHARKPVDGEAELAALVATGAVLRAARPAQALKDAIFPTGATGDDVAILVVSVGNATAPPSASQLAHWTFDAADAAAGQAARAALADALRAHGAAEDCISAAEVVLGELLGNATRHAPGPVDVMIDWSGDAPVLHVLDRGAGFDHLPALPKSVFSESGRGLFLIAQLSEDFAVTRGIGGGSHARAVLARTRLARDAGRRG